jgi:hypothetical protein
MRFRATSITDPIANRAVLYQLADAETDQLDTLGKSFVR